LENRLQLTMTTYLTYADQPPRTESNPEVIANLVRKGWVVSEPPVVEEVVATFTAEQHLDAVGLGGNRQPTLLYLRQAGAVSPKLDATEAFLNTVLAMFATDPSPRSDWPAAPHSFEDVVGQAVASLNPEA
jgi:hypothetical protein